MMTKSLHTVTAVKNVAIYILNTGKDGNTNRAWLTVESLAILGYTVTPDQFAVDATLQACLKAVKSLK